MVKMMVGVALLLVAGCSSQEARNAQAVDTPAVMQQDMNQNVQQGLDKIAQPPAN